MEVLSNRDTWQPSYGYIAIHDPVRTIVHHPTFQGFGELMLPWDKNTLYYDTPVKRVGSLMPYHSHVIDMPGNDVKKAADELKTLAPDNAQLTPDILSGYGETATALAAG
jgi:hypothetical protein